MADPATAEESEYETDSESMGYAEWVRENDELDDEPDSDIEGWRPWGYEDAQEIDTDAKFTDFTLPH